MTHDPHQCDCEACKTWRKATSADLMDAAMNRPQLSISQEEKQTIINAFRELYSGPRALNPGGTFSSLLGILRRIARKEKVT